MSTLHTQPYSSAQPATGTSTGVAADAVDAAAIGNHSASRDAAVAAAAAAAAAAAVASNSTVLSADYSRGYGAMAPTAHGQMLPPPTQLHSQQHQQQHQHQQHQQHQGHIQHPHHSQHHQHHHSLPSIDINGHAAAVAGYHSSYGLADGTSAAAGGMVGLMTSPTGTSWGPSPTSPLSSHSAVAAANAAALAAGQQHQSPGAWYSSVYQQPQYSPAGHGMVMYHDSYAQSPTAAAAAAAAAYYPPRARLTTTLWEDEQTLVYQVDCRGICVARRHDDNMINGTKLLNVVGMSRGKRDGILKNEKGRRVVKVGPMHLKGVWIPFDRARFLAEQFKVYDVLFPIFQPDPNTYLYGTIPMTSPTSAAGLPTSDPYSGATGYTQLARAQDAYDPSGVVAAAAAANSQSAAAAAAAAAAATASSSSGSHSHTASLSQVMAAHHQSPTTHSHHHPMSQGQQQAAQGLGINYIGSPSARMPGMPSSPPGSMAVSPAASYTEKGTRYAPYGTAFQTAGAKASGAGPKRGSVDHHYSQAHAGMQQQQPHSAKASLGQHHHQEGLAGSDQDSSSALAMAAGGSAPSQQAGMTSSYFEGLVAKNEQ